MERLGPGHAQTTVARARRVLDGHFDFLNETRALGTPSWRERHGSQLWNFHLQYHGYLPDLAWADRLAPGAAWVARIEELVESWLDQAGRGGGDAWEPYVLARRSSNWIRTLLLSGQALSPGIRDRMASSLHAQLRRLDRRVEYHLRGNHLLADLHALALGGLLFDGPAALRWRRERMAEYWEELRAQVLPDGMHEERSPMYHSIVLGDAIELVAMSRAAGLALAPDVTDRLERMAAALSVLSRPDGTLHLFNDTANGQALGRTELLDRSTRVLSRTTKEPCGPWSLPAAGYWGVIRPDGTRLVVDAGPPGPRWQPGHAHCDLLSFELDVEGTQVVVDSGVAGYGDHPLREYARSTRAHNTLSVAGLEQSEVWGTFRMARQAECIEPSASGDEESWCFRASCRHYHAPDVRHHRMLRLLKHRLVIEDVVTGAVGRRVDLWLHLHPFLKPRLVQGRWALEGAPRPMRLAFAGVESVSLAAGFGAEPPQGWYCPAFGRSDPSSVFELTLPNYDGRIVTTVLDWSDH